MCGDGKEAYRKCPHCGGMGKVFDPEKSLPFGDASKIKSKKCQPCKGSGVCGGRC
jgi:hypothetical protein